MTPPPPSAKSWEQLDFFKSKFLGVIGIEMDSGVSHLTIVHVRILINPKKLILSNLREFYLQVHLPPPLEVDSKIILGNPP